MNRLFKRPVKCFGLFAGVAVFLASSQCCAVVEQPLSADAFVRVTLIDRALKAMWIFLPTGPGKIYLPKLGTISFQGSLPASFARHIKALYVGRGIYTAERLTIVCESRPHEASDGVPLSRAHRQHTTHFAIVAD